MVAPVTFNVAQRTSLKKLYARARVSLRLRWAKDDASSALARGSIEAPRSLAVRRASQHVGSQPKRHRPRPSTDYGKQAGFADNT